MGVAEGAPMVVRLSGAAQLGGDDVAWRLGGAAPRRGLAAQLSGARSTAAWHNAHALDAN